MMSVEPAQSQLSDDRNEKVDRIINQIDLQLNSMNHGELDRSIDLDVMLDGREEMIPRQLVKLEMERAARDRLLILKEKLHAKKNTKHAAQASNEFDEVNSAYPILEEDGQHDLPIMCFSFQ